MRRTLRPEAVAVRGERPVPVRLQHLHDRLLDEAVEHRRDAERPLAARRLGYLHTPHRLRFVGAVKQLSPDPGPVLLQVGNQLVDGHPIEAGRPLVALHSCQCLLQIDTLDNRFHRRPHGRPAFEFGLRRSGFGPFRVGARGFTRRSGVQGDLQLSFLPHGPREIAALLAIPPFGPSAGRPRLLCPLLTSALRSGRLAATSVSNPRHSADLPR